MHCVYEVDDCSYSNILANINMTFDNNIIYLYFAHKKIYYIVFLKLKMLIT
jgi:hypothetical protein